VITGNSNRKEKQGITVVIPAFNQVENIGNVLTILKGVDEVDEIVVVDDGSQDETVYLVKEHRSKDERVRLISLPENMGKGNAILAGADASNNDILLFLDADLKNLEADHIRDLIRPVDRGDFIISVGLFEDGRWKTNITHNLFPFLSGQRCLRWSRFNNLYRKFINGWSIETALSLHARFKKYPVTYVMWQGATHAIRTEKRGLLAGCWSHFKMWLEIGKYFFHFLGHHLSSNWTKKANRWKWSLRKNNASYFNF
jgi:glycosyltransferase involved in cell wall biosynthesis